MTFVAERLAAFVKIAGRVYASDTVPATPRADPRRQCRLRARLLDVEPRDAGADQRRRDVD